MPKYLVQGAYTSAGAKGVISEGGSSRREAIVKAAEAAGGSVDCLYFAFGDDDVLVIFDFPDNVSAASVSMTAAASGLVNPKTTVLLSAEEIDEAARRSVSYRGPGE